MKSKMRMRKAALGCLVVCLVASVLGCHGFRPRYGLLFRGDMSAELWKLPEEGGGAALAEKENQGASMAEGDAAACSNVPSQETACTEAACPELPCRRPLCMGLPIGGGRAEEVSEPAPPPMIAARFFPVPTKPVFTPRGDLSNLNPYMQRTMPAPGADISGPEILSPEVMVPETSCPEVFQESGSEALPSPVPETPATLPYPSEMDYSISSSTRSHWVFVPQVSKLQDRDKAYELIASGSQLVK